jgi:hypothetical protein
MHFLWLLVPAAGAVLGGGLAVLIHNGAGPKWASRCALLVLCGCLAAGSAAWMWRLFLYSHGPEAVIRRAWRAADGNLVVVASEGKWWERLERTVFVVSQGKRISEPSLGGVRATYWSQAGDCLYVIRTISSALGQGRMRLSRFRPSSNAIADLMEVSDALDSSGVEIAVDAQEETLVVEYREGGEHRLVAVRIGQPWEPHPICGPDGPTDWQLMPVSGNVYFTPRGPATVTCQGNLYKVAIRGLPDATPELVLPDVDVAYFEVSPSEMHAAVTSRSDLLRTLRLFPLDRAASPQLLTSAMDFSRRPRPTWAPDGSRLFFVDREGLRAFVMKKNRVRTLVPGDGTNLPCIQTITCLRNGDVFFVRDYEVFWQYLAADHKLRRLLRARDLKAHVSQ